MPGRWVSEPVMAVYLALATGVAYKWIECFVLSARQVGRLGKSQRLCVNEWARIGGVFTDSKKERA